MTTKKLKLAFIEKDIARKLAYKNRKNSLVKKVEELTTLCGIDACAIIYGPYDPQPEIWPSPSGVQNVISKFKTASEYEQRKKMVNQESFLKERISKAEKQLNKQWRDNKEKETTMLIFQCLNAGGIVPNDSSVAGLNDLALMIDKNLMEIGRRIEISDSNSNIHQSQGENQITTAQFDPPLPLLQPPPPPPPTVSDVDEVEMMSRLGWL
ncbi:agamous-like MADS-box protein AGL80 [Vicia villosa]|uniref:agamous-like MADS-box protein AGL80 n=1 Tax=Vicia villosa TaxID=3911 RepID=UPI00273C0745|nr:agamous-like MADS-box protein AGL80 [Vicia villosa]XP_058783805.1 agamous-like MADS-box protein AGL80 [Vicia villosa]